ncbi:MAG: amidohydrolase family protein [Acidobacteriota bacterium]
MNDAERTDARRRRRSLLCLFLPALLSLAPAAAQPVLYEGVTVIDPGSRSVLEDQRIVVRGKLIRGIEPSSTPRGRGRVVDAQGLFAIPGLIDLHVHVNTPVLSDDDLQWTLDKLLDHGVTGVRDMATGCWPPRFLARRCLDDMRTVQRELERGKRRGPRLLKLSSGVVYGSSQRDNLPEDVEAFWAPETFEEGELLGQALRRKGFDLIKIYNSVSRDAYRGILRGAGDLEVSGHLPLGVSLVDAAQAGHRTLEHARDLPLACSRYGSTYRDTMEKVLAGDLATEPPTAEERLRNTLDSFDEELCDKVLSTLAETGTWLVPTHGTREMDARAAEEEYRAAIPDDLPKMLRLSWNRDLKNTAEVAPQLGELYEIFYRLGIELTGRAHRAGVRVVVGTDANDTMIVPGLSVHEELERLAEAGLEPMEILRAATTLPAEYLSDETIGALAAGKRADFLLLRANPLDDISNTRTIETVVLGGEPQ